MNKVFIILVVILVVVLIINRNRCEETEHFVAEEELVKCKAEEELVKCKAEELKCNAEVTRLKKNAQNIQKELDCLNGKASSSSCISTTFPPNLSATPPWWKKNPVWRIGKSDYFKH